MAESSSAFKWKDHWLYSTAQLSAILLAIYFWHYLPSPGYAVAVLAVLAAAMSVHTDMRGWQKAVWMLLIGAFLLIEFRAIDEDRRKDEESQAKIRKEERDSFKSILDQGAQNLKSILDQQQNHFESTVKLFIDAQQHEAREFRGVLAKQQQLYEHEEQVAESLNGQLIPANEKTPPNACPPVPSDGAIVMVGDLKAQNASVFSKFPHTIIVSERRGPVLVVDKTPSGSLALVLDLRSNDGKIIARIDKNGFVLNRNNYLEVKRDKSSLIIIDEYGTEVLNIRYINSRAIAVSGKGIGMPKGFERGCFYLGNIIDISLP
jgi:hypothetical protein